MYCCLWQSDTNFTWHIRYLCTLKNLLWKCQMFPLFCWFVKRGDCTSYTAETPNFRQCVSGEECHLGWIQLQNWNDPCPWIFGRDPWIHWNHSHIGTEGHSFFHCLKAGNISGPLNLKLPKTLLLASDKLTYIHLWITLWKKSVWLPWREIFMFKELDQRIFFCRAADPFVRWMKGLRRRMPI